MVSSGQSITKKEKGEDAGLNDLLRLQTNEMKENEWQNGGYNVRYQDAELFSCAHSWQAHKHRLHRLIMMSDVVDRR